MSHFFIDAVRAWNQIGFLFGGFLLLGLGSFLVAHEIRWRLHALRVDGTISGVRQKAGMYYSVYRYTLPTTGVQIEATSSSGSSLASGRVTGTSVPLLVFPDNPERVEPANSWLGTVIGLVLIVPGVVFLGLAWKAGPITQMTWRFLGLALLYFATRLKKILIPKDQRLAPSSWKTAKQQERHIQLQAIPVRTIEDILSQAENPGTLASRRQATRLAAPLLLLFGCCLGAGGLWTGAKAQHLAATGQRASGVVVSLQRGNNGRASYPVVRFTTRNDEMVEFRDRVSTNPPLYKGGETVTVLYLEDNPRQTAVIDHRAWNWLVPGLLLMFSLLLLGAGAKLATAPVLN